ncbi:MAG: tyrosine recombinase [Myxococcota bacterium]|nr:tyrosine recombinase [Myxococcota bacterium]
MKRELEIFLDYCRAECNLREITVISYQTDIEGFFSFLLSVQVDDAKKVRDHHITSWFEKMRLEMDRDELGGKTILRRKVSIRRFFRFLFEEDLIASNPTAYIEPEQNIWRLPKIISEKQVEVLLSKPDQSKFLGLRDAAMLELMYSTGLRVSELINLQFDWIKAGWLEVIGKRDKKRIVPFSDKAASLLNRYLAQRGRGGSEFVFLSSHKKPMTRQNFWGTVKKYGKMADMEEVSPHILRHAFATHMLNNNADLRALQLMLGHEDISTTEIYTQVSKRRLKQVHEKHHPRGEE